MPALPERTFTQLVALPGKALAVFMILSLRSRLERSPTITLTSAFLGRFGVGRREKAKALQQLEGAGFITVARRARRNPVVTLLQ